MGLVSIPRLRRWICFSGFLLAMIVLAGCGGGSTAVVEPAPKPDPPAPAKLEPPPHPTHLDVATHAQEKAAARQAVIAEAEPEPAPEPSKPPPPGSMPAASAGTNGSYTPPPPSQRKVITPRVIERMERWEAEGRAVLLSGIALAPPSAPQRIKAAISAANTIVGRPYIWGGGHASWYSNGYDCSGRGQLRPRRRRVARGAARLDPAGVLGRPGPGALGHRLREPVHAYAVIAGLRWDTVGDERHRPTLARRPALSGRLRRPPPAGPLGAGGGTSRRRP